MKFARHFSPFGEAEYCKAKHLKILSIFWKTRRFWVLE